MRNLSVALHGPWVEGRPCVGAASSRWEDFLEEAREGGRGGCRPFREQQGGHWPQHPRPCQVPGAGTRERRPTARSVNG